MKLLFALVAALGLAAASVSAATAAPTVVLETTKGPVTIKLRPDLAPRHVERIETLVREKFYDGVPFHRVIAGFMAQTGDPTGTGQGGSSYPDLAAEFSKESFKRGTVGMARTQDPNSANSQFFICFAPASHLDGEYTIVGEVVEGMDVVDKLARGSGGGGVVAKPDRIKTMRLAGDRS
jgi:peptidylprolyl isomerase